MFLGQWPVGTFFNRVCTVNTRLRKEKLSRYFLDVGTRRKLILFHSLAGNRFRACARGEFETSVGVLNLGRAWLLDSKGSDLFFRLGTKPAAGITEQEVHFDYVFVSLPEVASEVRLDQFFPGMERENRG